MTEREEWRPLVGYEGHYEISSLGRLCSLKKGRRRVLSLATDGNGYAKASVCVGGKPKAMRISRAVLTAFVGSPPSKEHEAAHCNGDHTDNRLANLRWATRAENASDKVVHGTINRGLRNGIAKLNESEVREIFRRVAGGEKQRAVARDFGVHFQCVNDIVRGRTWVWLGLVPENESVRTRTRSRQAKDNANARRRHARAAVRPNRCPDEVDEPPEGCEVFRLGGAA